MNRRRRRLFVQQVNISGRKRTPIYQKFESKRGGFPKLEAVSGGRIGGRVKKDTYGREKYIKGDYWQLEPIRKKGQTSAKKRLPLVRRPRLRSPMDYVLSPESKREVRRPLPESQERIKLIPKRNPMVVKKTQLKSPEKVAASRTNAANKFHSDGVKTGSRGYAGATKPTLTSTSPKPLEPLSLERKSVKTTMSNNAFDKRTIHHMKFNTGFKPTNPIFRLAKNNGTIYQTLIDTKQSWKTAERVFLNHACGFNSRAFIIPPRDSFVSVRDVVEDIFGLSGTLTPTNELISGSRYGALMSVVSQFMIHNQSAYMPCKVVAHLCQFDHPRSNLATEINQYFETQVFNADVSVQTNGALPVFYQHGSSVGEQISSDSFKRTVHCDVSYKGKGLYDSANFKNNFTIVKTESVRLEAGDFLNLMHTHECGPGVDLGKLHLLYNQQNNMKNAPFSFFTVFELQGYECEGLYKATDALHTYIGKSPAYISYEFKKSYLAAAEAAYPNAGSQPVVNQAAIRDFASTSRDISTLSTTKEFFVLPENIVGTVPTVTGELSVSVSTDKARVIHTTATDSSGTEANP